jgi:hypothetical protein
MDTQRSSLFKVRSFCAILFCGIVLLLNLEPTTLHAQSTNSTSITGSIKEAKSDKPHLLELARRMLALNAKQLASMRVLDVTGDTIPERLRVWANIIPRVGKMRLHFSITQGKRVVFATEWSASEYFAPEDSLPDIIKLKLLRRNVTVFFANENFSTVDSAGIAELIRANAIAEIKPDSKEEAELERIAPITMLSVFQGRDLFYGLAWLPSKKRMVKVWRN